MGAIDNELSKALDVETQKTRLRETRHPALNDLSARARQVIGDLFVYESTAEVCGLEFVASIGAGKLMRKKMIGARTVAEIRDMLTRYGMHFNDEIAAPTAEEKRLKALALLKQAVSLLEGDQ